MLELKFIKNKENALLSLNETINNCGNGKEIAKMIDNLIFGCLSGWCSEKENLDDYCWNIIYTEKAVREMFYNIDENKEEQ